VVGWERWWHPLSPGLRRLHGTPQFPPRRRSPN